MIVLQFRGGRHLGAAPVHDLETALGEGAAPALGSANGDVGLFGAHLFGALHLGLGHGGDQKLGIGVARGLGDLVAVIFEQL